MMTDVLVAFWMTAGIAAIEALLLAAILRKAGFNWLIAATALAPIVGLSLQMLLIFHGHVTPSEGIGLVLPLTLLPFLILTFKLWPLRLATSPETSQ